MHVFGLTGGIGSGKSTVAARFRARGLPVVDSDQVSREVVEPGTDGLEQVVQAFGTRVLTATGHLDRRALAQQVFDDDDARSRLNSILHPLVRARTWERLEQLDARGEPLVCNEVPLLVEVGLASQLRPLVVVTASDSVRIARAASRDQATEAQVRARLRAQLPLADKAALADYVIDNDGAVEHTLERADEVLIAICRSLGIDPARYPLHGFRGD